MFSTTLNEDIREIQEQIEIISEKIGDPDFCEKVKMFVIAPLEIQQIFKADAGSFFLLSLSDPLSAFLSSFVLR